MHDRIGLLFRWTVHAPHCAMPQPYFVPLRSRTSRSTQSSGMSAGTSTVTDRPFTRKVTFMTDPPSKYGSGPSSHGRFGEALLLWGQRTAHAPAAIRPAAPE